MLVKMYGRSHVNANKIHYVIRQLVWVGRESETNSAVIGLISDHNNSRRN